eukprot:m51a1_g1339 hypothetical protein (75) ;mRNA; r:319925-320374
MGKLFIDPKFNRVRKELEASFPGISIVGNEQYPREGAFEVTDENGTVYWSKLSADHGFPKEGEITKRLKSKGFQ